MKNNRFAAVLNEFMNRDGRSVRRVAEACAKEWGASGVSHRTISRWLQGQIKKPRFWADLAKVAIVLGLSEAEVDELLVAAHHCPIGALREMERSASESALLAHWAQNETGMPRFVPFQAPPALFYFTGREAEVEALEDAIVHQGGMFCLQGMGGVGKTTLATHLAYQLRPYFPDGVLWAQLDGADTMSILAAFADAYGQDVSHYRDLSSRSGRVRGFLADKRALMILDDVQRDEEIRPLLPPTGSCCVIMTTRRHDLSAADNAQRFNILPFSKQKREALALFYNILASEQSKKERQALREIADYLGHLPLAIAIAANRIKHEPGWSASAFLKRVRQQPRRLRELKRGDQAVRLSFDLSYQALPAHLQALFATLGVFGGEDFSVEAVAHVAQRPPEDAEDDLRQLYSLSLVQLGRAERYKLHPLLRDYSREQLSDARAFERMVLFFVDYIILYKNEYDQLDLLIGNLFVALNVAFEQEMKAALLRGAIALYEFLQARGLYEQAILHLSRAQDAAKQLNDTHSLVSVLRYLGRIAGKQGKYAKAEALYQEGLSLARQVDNKKQIAAYLTSLGALADKRADLTQAKLYFDEGLRLARENSDQPRIAALLINLGVMAVKRGDYRHAESYYVQALQLERQFGQRKQILTVLLQNLGGLMDDLGDYVRAKAYFEEGLSLADEIGDPELKSCMLGNLGLVVCALGDYAAARNDFLTGLTLAKENNLALEIARQLANLGKLAYIQGNYKETDQYCQDALRQAHKNGFPFDICVILNQWGESHLAQKKWPEAEKAFREALEIAQKAKLQAEIAKSLAGLAHLLAKRGQKEDARQLGQESLVIFTAIGHKRASVLNSWLSSLSG